MISNNLRHPYFSISIEAFNLGKRYGHRLLFKDLSFSIGEGKCLGITGRNGSGKSTLIKMIAGIIRPSSGDVRFYINGVEFDEEKRLAHLGMVSPDICLYDRLTGIENVKIIAGLRGIHTCKEKAAYLCTRVGLKNTCGDIIQHYSTGMKQRLKFALLLAVNPAIWLLDEPTANLDDEGKTLILSLVSQALVQGKTLIIASNDSREIHYADKRIALT